jgi:hypothetical protein
MIVGIWSPSTTTRFSAPCRVATTDPSEARISEFCGSGGVASTDGRSM